MRAMRFAASLRSSAWLFAAILLYAFWLRANAIGFGLPFLFHADEPIVVNHALAYSTGDLNPHFFRIPPLVSYLLFGFYGLSFVVGKLLGVFSSPQDFEHLFYADPSFFYFSGRLIFGAVLGTLTVLFFYRGVKRHTSLVSALLSSFIFATCFLHVRDSHYLYVDIPLLFVMVLFLNRLLGDRLETKQIVLTAFLVGLATAVKYNGVFLIIPFFLHLAWGSNLKETLSRWTLGALISAATFFLLNPFSVLDYEFFIKEMFGEAAAHVGGTPWLHHLRFSLYEGVGMPLLMTVFVCSLLAIFKAHKQGIILTVFLGVYYGVIYKMGQPYGRYVLPLIPPMMYLLAYGVHTLLTSGQNQKMYKTAVFILVIAIVMPNLAKSLQFNAIMNRPDTRVLAKEWIERHIPAGSKIALDSKFTMPVLEFTAEQLELKKSRALQDPNFSEAKLRKLNYLINANPQPAYELYFLKKDMNNVTPFLFDAPNVEFDKEKIDALGIDYVVLAIRVESDLKSSLRQQLQNDAKRLVRISPYEDDSIRFPFMDPLTGGPFLTKDIFARERNGQVIEIYALEG